MPDETTLSAEEVNDYLHALGALCLYGQPFGFSREDMELLRDIINYAETGKVPEPWMAARLAAHMGRIAALLPPESE